jgi:tetratricopeptide (TPR) repeat protein
MPVGKFLAALLVSATLGACATDPQAASQRYVASGDQYVAQGRSDEAVIEYRNAVDQDPRAGAARVKLADAYVEAGAGEQALAEYVRAADLLPDDSTVHVKAGTMLALAGRFDDAKLWAEKVLAKEPTHLSAQILLANSLAGLDNLDAAVVQIEEAIQLNPDRGESYTNLGAFELGRGKKQAAERAFKTAVKLDGTSTAARLALANFYWVDARWSAAEEQLRTVVQLDAANVLAHRALANFYIATNRAPEAEAHLLKVRDLTMAPAAAFALVDYYTARQDEASARAVLEPLTQVSETAAPAEVRLARLDYAGGRVSAAYERIARVLEKDQASLNALLAKSAFLLSDGRVEEALPIATLAVEKYQDSSPALFTLGRVQSARHQTAAAITAFEGVLRVNPRATDAKMALASLHLAAGRPDTSLGLAREVVASNPKNIEARITIVRGLLAARELPRAQAELDGLLSQAPDSVAVHVLLGMLKGHEKNAPGARKHFERALQLDPDSLEALGGLVAVDLANRHDADALARVDARVGRTPSDPAVLMLAARTHAATGDSKQTETLLRRALQADAGYLEAYGALAQLYVSQRRLDAALVEFEQLATREPRPVAALTFAGIILQGQGKTNEARDHFVRVLALDPDAAVAANNLAWLYAQTDDKLDLAMNLALRSRAKLPDRPEVNDTVGWVHYRKGLAAQAIPFFEKSIEKDATNADYHYHLGLAYVKSGDMMRGRRAIDRALQLKPDFQGSAEAKQTLVGLRSDSGGR